MQRDSIKVILSAILCLIVIAFIFSLFKNIQYPLLWNDESETAMYAKRIMQYGYPKIHDGKNIVWLSELPDKGMGLDKRRDSPDALVWGQYYFAAIGEFFAAKTEDVYLKTAFLRIPFAAAGLAGLFIMAMSVIRLFGKSAVEKLIFLNAFFLFALASVALTLHLREVRHPALVVLLSAAAFSIYFDYRFFDKIKSAIYFIGLTLCLFLLYHVLHVVFFVFLGSIALYEFIAMLRERNIRRFLGNIAPVITAFVLVMPFFMLCQTSAFGKAYRLLYAAYIPSWAAQVSGILSFFRQYELLYVVLAARALFICSWFYFSQRGRSFEKPVRQKMQVSNFLTLFFIVYLSMIAVFPHAIIFERYYILLIPVAAIILLLDIFGTFDLFSGLEAGTRRYVKWLYAASILAILVVNSPDRIDHIKGHAHELLHRYRGPLDFAIPFIKSNYKNTADLVIATNYEELAYMYYLGSKVIVGFVGNNIEEDAKMRPDIIIFRKSRSPAYLPVFKKFIAGGRYERVSFPVFDYFVNNIPELKSHLYLTPDCGEPDKSLDLFIKTDA
ncbi:MAG: hypothetical protein WC522_05895 [Candidatus Omnitrophota bacterium]